MDEDFGPAAIAIYTGDLGTLAELLASDPELAVRESSVSHPTLLQLVACDEPEIEDPVGAARLLIEAGALTSRPLVAAAGCNSRSVLEYLLECGVPVDGDEAWTPLDEALYWSNQEIVSVLLSRGAEIRSLRTAAGVGDVITVEQFFRGDTLTDNAGPIQSPFADTVPEAAADNPDSIIDNAFVMAVNNGGREAAEHLVRRGARVNRAPPGYHWHGTALHAAVWRGDRHLVEWLLSVGADPTIRDGLAHSDSIGWANHHGHPELVDLLAR